VLEQLAKMFKCSVEELTPPGGWRKQKRD